MITIKSFRAIRPRKEYAKDVAALPYDVMSSEEARNMVEGNNKTFLRVDRAEVNLDKDINQYSPIVYETAKMILNNMIKDGVLLEEEKECLYIYEQVFKGNRQRGIVLCASIDDYISGKIKKHENTTVEKEMDRINHIDYCNANTGPIFVTYKNKENISALVEEICRLSSPIYDFLADDGVQNRVWIISEGEKINKLVDEFKLIDSLYIADGHHRAASAIKVGEKRRSEHKGYTGKEEFNYFLAVAIPDNELKIMGYNRVVKDLNNLSNKEFLNRVEENFIINKVGDSKYLTLENQHKFGMFLNDIWYILEPKKGIFNSNNIVDQLDVSILQENLLNPILNIINPRNDNRIEFIGGIRGIEELEKRVRTDMKVAFLLYPTKIQEIMDVADNGGIMPPKSTWFEPKLRSGLFIHKL